MEVPISEGPSWDQLLKVLDVCRLWSFEKRRSIGCLCVIAIGVLGLHRGSKIPLDLARRVIDVETFERFPWGRKACEKLVEDIKVVQYVGDSYCIPGFVHVLQIWGYEAISILGESVSRKEHDIPLLAWPGSRGRTKIADLLFKDKNKHGKVRVRHIFSISEEDVISSWTDEEEDENVDELLNDIIEGTLNCGFWSKDTKSEKKRGKKRKVDLVVEECSDDDFVEKKKKVVRIMNGSKHKKSRDDEDGRNDDFQEPVRRESSKVKAVTQNKQKKKVDNEPDKEAEKGAEKVADKQPEKEAEKQAEKQADKSKIGEKIDVLKGEMEGRMSAMERSVDGKIEKLGKVVDKGKGVVKGLDKEVVQSTNQVVEDCGENKQPDKKIADDAEGEMRKPNSEDTLSVSYDRDITAAKAKRIEKEKGIGKRSLFLATTQKSPFQGDSTMKRHINSFMHMMRKRSMAQPTPFTSSRIAFLDQSWVISWHHDYKQFAMNPKKFLFGETYTDVMMGRYPANGPTNKQWVKDVDHVYFCHNLHGNHWIPMKKYTIYRKKSVPQNIQEGDCGVYSVKYLECLALGISFAGLCDENMPFIRKKMDVEIYDEVPDELHEMSNPLPRSKNDDKLLLLTDSLK
ncbi:unnamed protein product [Cochlearia groenlandica]